MKMIVDSKGNAVSLKLRSPRDEPCPECGAAKENRKPTLGGWVTCMRCGYQIREIKIGTKTPSR